jgi:uncharacterized phage protein (TIGR02220 family)
MAKELPYFKFEPQEWESGLIQMCSNDSKALFIQLCCTYWTRLGSLPYAFALHKHCNGNESALQELNSNDVISIENGNIIIKFLDDQLKEFNNVSEKRKQAANKRWNNASALQVDSKSNAIREEKKREEEIKKDKIDYDFFLSEFNRIANKRIRIFDEKAKKQLKARLKDGYTIKEILTAVKNCKADPYHIQNTKYLTLEFITRPDKLSKYISRTKIHLHP